MKVKISLADPETRRVWEACLRARDLVASWPAWKRGEDVPAERPELPPRVRATPEPA